MQSPVLVISYFPGLPTRNPNPMGAIPYRIESRPHCKCRTQTRDPSVPKDGTCHAMRYNASSNRTPSGSI